MLRTVQGWHFLKIKNIGLHTCFWSEKFKKLEFTKKKQKKKQKKHFLKAPLTVCIVCIH